MLPSSRRMQYYFRAFVKRDFRASVTVFFVALPLCLGISLASGAPLYSGLIAGIIGGIVVSVISRSELSVSGPAAGLTAICAAAITELGDISIFFLSVAVAGLLQIVLGLFRLGGFTHLIPSAVIKGMLAAIGIILVSKQIPLVVGYDQPDFWTNHLFNIFTLDHAFLHMGDLYRNTSFGAIVVAVGSLVVLGIWKKTFLSKKFFVIPTSFVTVLSGILIAIGFNALFPEYRLEASKYVSIPKDIFSQIQLPNFSAVFSQAAIWRNAVIICFVASLETLLSVAAIDKLDPFNRISPQNRELVAQGTGNFLSGLVGGIPITAVIVRSSANAEAGARTRMSAFAHGLWLLLAVLFFVPLLNLIPYSVLAVILIRTGYNLAKPKMILAVYRQGREQFLPFIVTVVAILFTDLLIGVLIGCGYAFYFLIKHTYEAGFTVRESQSGHNKRFAIKLDSNVSFLNKKRMLEALDKIPEYSEVVIDGTDSVYIDRDILEIIQEFRSKAQRKHIDLSTINIPDVETIELH